MFDREAYQRDRNNSVVVAEDQAAGYTILTYVISEIDDAGNTLPMPNRYRQRKDAMKVLKAMPPKKRKAHVIEVEILKPIGGGNKPATKNKEPEDKHHAAGQQMVRVQGKGYVMVSRKTKRNMRQPNRAGSSPTNGRDFKHSVNEPRQSSHSYPPEMTNKERMEYRRDARLKRIEAEEAKNATN